VGAGVDDGGGDGVMMTTTTMMLLRFGLERSRLPEK
jgi:hypothetical protein